MSSLNIIFLIFAILLLLGLCLPSLSNKEHFSISDPLSSIESGTRSAAEDVESGASDMYNWGYHELGGKKKRVQKRVKKSDDYDEYDVTQDSDPICIEDDKCDKPEICSKCDIALNKDISKYVLKSSVPPCPDMSNYIEKRNLPPYPNMNKYILKSKVPACKKTNMDDYILKSKIPPCAPCRPCPPSNECPECDDCPAAPDMDNYIRKDELDQICRNRGGNGDPVDDNNGSWLPNISWPSWLAWKSDNTIDDESTPTDNPILPQSGSNASSNSGSNDTSAGSTDTSAGNSSGLGDTSGSFNSIVDGESAQVQEGFGNIRSGVNNIAFGKMAGSGCTGVCCGNYGGFGQNI